MSKKLGTMMAELRAKLGLCNHNWQYERKGHFIREKPFVLDGDNDVIVTQFDEAVDKKCEICGEVEDATGERIGRLPAGRVKTVTIDTQSITQMDFLDVEGMDE